MSEDIFICEECYCTVPEYSYPYDGAVVCADCREDDGEADETPRQQADAEYTDDLLAVDFDGTLTQGQARYWVDGEREESNESVCEWVRNRYYEGAYVVVWTARPWSEASTIAARLTEWAVPFHGIRCEKGGADLYVDDKAVEVTEIETDE